MKCISCQTDLDPVSGAATTHHGNDTADKPAVQTPDGPMCRDCATDAGWL